MRSILDWITGLRRKDIRLCKEYISYITYDIIYDIIYQYDIIYDIIKCMISYMISYKFRQYHNRNHI